MARGRMINKTVAIDRRLNLLSVESHLLYLMTIPHLDRDGLIAGDPPLLKAAAVPRREELHPRIAELVQEWLAAELVIRYETPDTAVLFFPGFAKNQTLQYSKEGPSQFPPPPGYIRTSSGIVPAEPIPTLELVQSNARPTLELPMVKLKGIEDKVEDEVKGKELPPPPASESSSYGREQARKLQTLNGQVSPALRTPLANALLDITGKRRLADVGGSEGDRLLLAAHEAAVTLYRLGLKSESDILALEPAWNDDWRGVNGGTVKQFLEFVSEQQAGKTGKRSNGNGKTDASRGFGLASLTTDADRAYHASIDATAIAELQAEFDRHAAERAAKQTSPLP